MQMEIGEHTKLQGTPEQQRHLLLIHLLIAMVIATLVVHPRVHLQV